MRNKSFVAILSISALLMTYQNCGESFDSEKAASIANDSNDNGGNNNGGGNNNNPSLQAFDVGVVYTSSRFISLTGNDANAGTRENPFRTLQRALQGITAGTEVVILPGTYPSLGGASN